MILHYFKIAIRNLQRHKSSSIINISGLSVGLSCCAIIGLYVEDEVNYNRYVQKADRIFRISNTVHHADETRTLRLVAAPVGPALKEEFPEIAQTVRFLSPYEDILVSKDDKRFHEKELYIADAGVLEMFDLRLSVGDAPTALLDRNSVVVSSTVAQKYFGTENPLGKTLRIERGSGVFTVTGVLEAIPRTADIRPDFIIPFDNLHPQQLSNWLMFSFETYVQLADDADIGSVEAQLNAFVKRHYSDAPEGFPDLTFGLEPLSKIHLESKVSPQSGERGAISYLYGLAALGVVVLLVAVLNYVHLATAQAYRRSREVGLRKIVGISRSQLIQHFLSESVMLTLFAAIVAIGLVELFLPTFNELAGKQLELDMVARSDDLLLFMFAAVGVGLLSGAYPAMVLSRFQPGSLFRTIQKYGAAGSRVRWTFVIVQFVCAISLTTVTAVIDAQMTFIRTKNLGFDQDLVVSIPLRGSYAQHNWQTYKEKLRRHSNIIQSSAASTIPGERLFFQTGVRKRGDGQSATKVYSCQTDHDYLETLKLQLASGRFLSAQFPTDSTHAFVLNESAVRALGWKSSVEAIGQPLEWLGNGPEQPKSGTVVGVVGDFHLRPMYEAIAPVVFHLERTGLRYLLVRLGRGELGGTLKILEDEWASFDPRHPFEFNFLDQRIAAQYESENRTASVLGISSGFAMAISCMGLIGLVSFMLFQRTKEIGIRKVLGASVGGISTLISREIVGIVVIASVIAAPISYFASSRFLEVFAYRVAVTPHLFVLSSLASMIVAAAAIGGHVMRAARANPVESLGYG